ncbi:MAG: hypothetical protein D6744_13795 [Planctomycetota bacterium]|nr:MAG: hypothetical protein D6744_13795 [Planctomycetota bacterium]
MNQPNCIFRIAMPENLIEDSFDCLGLQVGATNAEVREAFFRQVRRLHPDVNPTPDAAARLQRVVAAYRRIQRWFGGHWSAAAVCSRCGAEELLLPTLEGTHACAECLLGRTARRRTLPMPEFVTVRHLAVFGLYVAAVVLLGVGVRENRTDIAFLSLFFTVVGFATLTAQVLDVVRRR